jgi:hypothetical protein
VHSSNSMLIKQQLLHQLHTRNTNNDMPRSKNSHEIKCKFAQWVDNGQLVKVRVTPILIVQFSHRTASGGCIYSQFRARCTRFAVVGESWICHRANRWFSIVKGRPLLRPWSGYTFITLQRRWLLIHNSCFINLSQSRTSCQYPYINCISTDTSLLGYESKKLEHKKVRQFRNNFAVKTFIRLWEVAFSISAYMMILVALFHTVLFAYGEVTPVLWLYTVANHRDQSIHSSTSCFVSDVDGSSSIQFAE